MKRAAKRQTGKDGKRRGKKKKEWWESPKRPDPETRSLTRLGGDDIAVLDTFVESATWTAMRTPVSFEEQPGVVSDRLSTFVREKSTGGVESLKVLAARVLARHTDSISRELLRVGSWQAVWRVVWEQICILGLDSFVIFAVFGSAFGSELDFACHAHLPYAGTSMRFSARDRLLGETVVSSRTFKHRVDWCSGGANATVLLNSITQMSSLGDGMVALDLRGSGLNRTSPLLKSIMSIGTLRALDVSGLDVVSDPHLLTVWRMAMDGGSWSRLSVLCAGNVPYHSIGPAYAALFGVPSLHYIEGPAPVSGADNWAAGTDEFAKSTRFTQRHSLGFKLYIAKAKLPGVRRGCRSSIAHEVHISSRSWRTAESVNSESFFVRRRQAAPKEAGAVRQRSSGGAVRVRRGLVQVNELLGEWTRAPSAVE